MKWFKHDADANRDPKLEKVLMRYGSDGYALYWLCIELIAGGVTSTKINFDLEHDSEILGARLQIDSTRVEEIMRYMVGLSLFEVSPTTQRITCYKLATRIENSVVKNPELKKIQKDIADGKVFPGISGKTSDRLDETRLEENKKTSLPEWLNQESWGHFVVHRKAIKKPLTDLAAKLVWGKLEGRSHAEQKRLIDEAIEKRWASVFPKEAEPSRAREL